MKIPKSIKVSSKLSFSICKKDLPGFYGKVDFENKKIILNKNNEGSELIEDLFTQLLTISDKQALNYRYYLTGVTQKQIKGLSLFFSQMVEKL